MLDDWGGDKTYRWVGGMADHLKGEKGQGWFREKECRGRFREARPNGLNRFRSA